MPHATTATSFARPFLRRILPSSQRKRRREREAINLFHNAASKTNRALFSTRRKDSRVSVRFVTAGGRHRCASVIGKGKMLGFTTRSCRLPSGTFDRAKMHVERSGQIDGWGTDHQFLSRSAQSGPLVLECVSKPLSENSAC